jgi:hypothetical protein
MYWKMENDLIFRFTQLCVGNVFGMRNMKQKNVAQLEKENSLFLNLARRYGVLYFGAS